MVSLQKIRAVAPVHLMSEEASQVQIAAIEVKQPPMLPAVQTAATPKKAAPVTEAGVMTQLKIMEKAQEKVDAFLAQGAVFTLRQDLRFKHEKKDVMIEQGTRIRLDDARNISEDGKSVVVNLSSVTKDDWDNGCYDRKFRYYGLRININSLEKYFEPDVEVTGIMKRKDIFTSLFGASLGLSATLGIILFMLCSFSFVTAATAALVLSAIGSGLFGVLSVLWGVLCMRTRGAVYKRLQSAENQILQQRMMQHKDEGNNE